MTQNNLLENKARDLITAMFSEKEKRLLPCPIIRHGQVLILTERFRFQKLRIGIGTGYI